jgi:predicted Ser/Thr protein kinase
MQAGFPTGTEPDAGAKKFAFRPPTIEDLKPQFPQFEILALIGQGGMGAVYKARQPMLDRYVALKILPPEAATGPAFTERFTREARALARLNHPNIVAVHEFGRSRRGDEAQGQPPSGYHYLIMEFVDGVNLREMERAQRLNPAQALSIVPKICDALQYAHDEGVVHRDIKPENILVDKKGRVKIADFGIAKILGTETRVPLTGDQHVIGTPHYMAPEQVEKPQTVDHRADIYSLGVVFYEMLTGELPLGRFAAPSKKVQIDVRLDEIVLRALEKEPEQRYQQASVLKSQVETIAGTNARPQTEIGSTTSPEKAPLRMPRLAVHQSCVDARGIKDCWMWDTRYLVGALVISIVGATLLSFALLPVMGFRAFLFDLLSFAGIIPVIVYFFVGVRVRRLKAGLPADYLEACEAVFVRDANQRPGLAVLYDDRLELVPIAGSKITIALKDITSFRNLRWFNGTLLWAKEGIALNRVSGERLQLALPKPVAERWSGYFSAGPGTGPIAVGQDANPSSNVIPGLLHRCIRIALCIVAAVCFLDFVLPHSLHFGAGVRFGVAQPWLFLPHKHHGVIFNLNSTSFHTGIAAIFIALLLAATKRYKFSYRYKLWIFATAIVLVLLIWGRHIVEPRPKNGEPDLANSPQKLRSEPTSKVIAAGLSAPKLPWAWQELQGRGDLTSTEANEIMTGLTLWLQRDYPDGYHEPLFWLGDFLNKVHANHLISPTNVLAFLTAFVGNPSVEPLPRLRDNVDSLNFTAHLRTPWWPKEFGFELLNYVAMVSIDGQNLPVKAAYGKRWKEEYYRGELKSIHLTPGKHTLRCEVHSAIVSMSEMPGMRDDAPPAEWPLADKRWTRSGEAEFTVYPASEQMVTLSDDPALNPLVHGVISVDRIIIRNTKGQPTAVVSFNLVPNSNLPVSFDVSVQIGEQRVKCGNVWAVGETNHSSVSPAVLQCTINPLNADVSEANVILTPNTAAVEQFPSVTKIWGKEFVIPRVYVLRQDLPTKGSTP